MLRQDQQPMDFDPALDPLREKLSNKQAVIYELQNTLEHLSYCLLVSVVFNVGLILLLVFT